MFAGKDASRGLAKSSVKPEDAVAEWEDLGDQEKQVLEDWYADFLPPSGRIGRMMLIWGFWVLRFTFFSKRYNIVGKVAK